MLRTLVISILTYILTSCSASKTVPLFQQLKADTLQKPLTNILIGGIGSSATRIFLDQLASKLSSSFRAAGIKTSYQYLGVNLNKARENITRISTEPFSAILIFSPEGSEFFEIQNYTTTSTNTSSIGPINTTSSVTRMSYSENFHALLYLTENKKTPVWIASLSIDTDPQSKYTPGVLSNVIYRNFKKNRYTR